MALRLAYCDSSVLVKRYVKEAGSADAARVMRRHRIATSVVALLEVASALVRRAADLDPEDLKATLARLREDRERWVLVELTQSVVARSEEVIVTERLPCLDAIHVASAIALQRELGPQVVFVTADRPHLEAATKHGVNGVFVE
jgi:predicted nucleic acid-binding protein